MGNLRRKMTEAANPFVGTFDGLQRLPIEVALPGLQKPFKVTPGPRCYSFATLVLAMAFVKHKAQSIPGGLF